jgi:VCBS repeat-containing protein
MAAIEFSVYTIDNNRFDVIKGDFERQLGFDPQPIAQAGPRTITLTDSDNVLLSPGGTLNVQITDALVDPELRSFAAEDIGFFTLTEADGERRSFEVAAILALGVGYLLPIITGPDGALGLRGTLPEGTLIGIPSDNGAPDADLFYNLAPAAADDGFGFSERLRTIEGDLFAENGGDADQDPEGDAFEIVAVNGAALQAGIPVTLASGGNVVVAADGTFTYSRGATPADLAAGETATDSFTYTIRDALGAESTATATIVVTGVAGAPGEGGGVLRPVGALDGFTTELFSGAALVVTGAGFDRGRVTVTDVAGGRQVTADTDGDGVADATFTVEGDFTVGDLMITTVGQGADRVTSVAFVEFAPDLVDGEAVAEADRNGIANPDYLTGDGEKVYSLSYESGAVAAYDNVLGVYTIGADGTISDVRIAYASTQDAQPGDAFAVGALAAGAQLGFFLIQNAADAIAPLLGDAFAFVDGGAAANAFEDNQPVLTANGVALDGLLIHHSTASMNLDGAEQVLSGVTTDAQGRLFVGFEDLSARQSNDFDYNDTVLAVLAALPDVT